jgi:hypothetical protein
MLVWGAWRCLGGKAKLYSSLRMDHAHDFPALGSYSTCVDATNRDSGELRGLLALILEYNRQVQCGYPIVLPDSTAVAVCKVARAHQHRPFRAWARTSKTGSGWWSGFKLHVHCDTAGRLSAFDLTTATVDDRKLLGPLTRGIGDGMVAGDSGSRSQAKARELATRGISLIPTPRKHRRALATQFQLACLQFRHRGGALRMFAMGLWAGADHTPRPLCPPDPLAGLFSGVFTL